MEISNLQIEDCHQEYYEIQAQHQKLTNQINQKLMRSRHVIKHLQPGKMVNIVNGEDKFGWGVVVSKRVKSPKFALGWYIVYLHTFIYK